MLTEACSPTRAQRNPQNTLPDADPAALVRALPAFVFRNRARVSPARRAVVKLADRQLGLVTWEQLCDAGITPSKVTRAVRTGRLRRVMTGVYAVGHAHLRDEAWLLAALLHAGPGACLCHQTAAWWHGVRPSSPVQIHVASPRRAPRTAAVVRHRLLLTADDVTVVRGLPVTAVARTLLDLAATVDGDELRRLIREASYRRAVEPGQITFGTTHPGTAALRSALDVWAPELAFTASELEERFVLLLRDRGLPPALINEKVRGYRVDAHWPDHLLVVELDGWKAHGTRDAFERDRRRDRVLQLAGWRVMRFTWREVVRAPDRVADHLRAALR